MNIPQHIKNIVFDLGGVLCGLDAARCIRAFHEIGADEVAVYVEEHRVEDLFLQAELGLISTQQFCDEVRRITRRPLKDKQIVWAWNELLTGITDERRQAVLRLAEGYRLFVLSNTNDMHWTKWESLFGGEERCDGLLFSSASDRWFATYERRGERENERRRERENEERRARENEGRRIFEQVFLSYRLHMAKPSEEIFRTVLHQAGIKAEETLFIDDSLVNCEAAEALGIYTFHNKHIDDWLRFL